MKNNIRIIRFTAMFIAFLLGIPCLGASALIRPLIRVNKGTLQRTIKLNPTILLSPKNHAVSAKDLETVNKWVRENSIPCSEKTALHITKPMDVLLSNSAWANILQGKSTNTVKVIFTKNGLKITANNISTKPGTIVKAVRSINSPASVPAKKPSNVPFGKLTLETARSGNIPRPLGFTMTWRNNAFNNSFTKAVNIPKNQSQPAAIQKPIKPQNVTIQNPADTATQNQKSRVMRTGQMPILKHWTLRQKPSMIELNNDSQELNNSEGSIIIPAHEGSSFEINPSNLATIVKAMFDPQSADMQHMRFSLPANRYTQEGDTSIITPTEVFLHYNLNDHVIHISHPESNFAVQLEIPNNMLTENYEVTEIDYSNPQVASTHTDAIPAITFVKSTDTSVSPVSPQLTSASPESVAQPRSSRLYRPEHIRMALPSATTELSKAIAPQRNNLPLTSTPNPLQATSTVTPDVIIAHPKTIPALPYIQSMEVPKFELPKIMSPAPQTFNITPTMHTTLPTPQQKLQAIALPIKDTIQRVQPTASIASPIYIGSTPTNMVHDSKITTYNATPHTFNVATTTPVETYHTEQFSISDVPPISKPPMAAQSNTLPHIQQPQEDIPLTVHNSERININVGPQVAPQPTALFEPIDAQITYPLDQITIPATPQLQTAAAQTAPILDRDPQPEPTEFVMGDRIDFNAEPQRTPEPTAIPEPINVPNTQELNQIDPHPAPELQKSVTPSLPEIEPLQDDTAEKINTSKRKIHVNPAPQPKVEPQQNAIVPSQRKNPAEQLTNNLPEPATQESMTPEPSQEKADRSSNQNEKPQVSTAEQFPTGFGPVAPKNNSPASVSAPSSSPHKKAQVTLPQPPARTSNYPSSTYQAPAIPVQQLKDAPATTIGPISKSNPGDNQPKHNLPARYQPYVNNIPSGSKQATHHSVTSQNTAMKTPAQLSNITFPRPNLAPAAETPVTNSTSRSPWGTAIKIGLYIMNVVTLAAGSLNTRWIKSLLRLLGLSPA